MVCPHCEGAERVFSNSFGEDELKNYRRKGASKTTQAVIDVLTDVGVAGMSLLDIGGGVGAIQHGLMQAGAYHVVDVDASSSYLKLAKSEAERLGYIEHAEYVHGDFVQMADRIEAQDIVTLDRVVCCYPHMEALINLSSKRAKKYYALVYPVDNFITRWGINVFNFFAFKIHGNPFRTYIHPTKTIDAIIQTNGLNRLYRKQFGLWQVFVYQR